MNLASIIDGHADDAVALIARSEPTTYGQLRSAVDRCRGGLVELGVQRGDRVALLCTNDTPFVVTYLAVLGIGAVAAPLNPLSPGPEIEREVARIEATAVVIDAVSADAWAHVDRSAVPSLRHVVVAGVDDAPQGAVPLATLLAATPVDRVDVDPDDLAVLAFTSGTAGMPRAAMLTHGNLLASLEMGDSSGDPLTTSDLVYGVLPLFHIFGFNVLLAGALRAGAGVLLVQRFDPLTAAESIAKRKVTVVPGAPPMWVAFAHFDELAPDSFATVRLALSGAARLPRSAFDTMRARFGIEVVEGYGLTEASPAVTTGVGAPVRPGSVGRAFAGVELRLVNVNGEALVGDVGEIWVRGPNVFPGYWEDPEATRSVLTDDGWLRTGDLGTVDDDGYLYLVDRSKDLVIVSGFNVYPAEVEEAIASHPDVAEVGVVGVPHPHTGEAVKAFVVTRPGRTLGEEQLIEHVLEQLARYKCPSKIIFVDELPRNDSGKLVRRQLEVPMA